MKAPSLMNGYHNRPDLPSPITRRRVLRHRRRLPPRRERLPLSSSAAPTTCSCRAARTSIPGDVERMLERHPDIAQACVVPIDDEIKGQKPVAFVILKPGQRPNGEEVKQFALATRPPTSTRASSGSWTNCRSPRPTRWTGARCGSLRRSGSPAGKQVSARVEQQMRWRCSVRFRQLRTSLAYALSRDMPLPTLCVVRQGDTAVIHRATRMPRATAGAAFLSGVRPVHRPACQA